MCLVIFECCRRGHLRSHRFGRQNNALEFAICTSDKSTLDFLRYLWAYLKTNRNALKLTRLFRFRECDRCPLLLVTRDRFHVMKPLYAVQMNWSAVRMLEQSSALSRFLNNVLICVII